MTKNTIGSALEQAGYTTFLSGEHHELDHAADSLGFGGYYGLWSGASSHFNPGVQRRSEPVAAQKRIRKWIIDGEVQEPYTPEDKDFYTTDAFSSWRASMTRDQSPLSEAWAERERPEALCGY